MQRFLCFLLIGLLAVNMCMAQFSAFGGKTGNSNLYTIQPAKSTGLDKVFIFDGVENAKISYITDSSADWTWYKFDRTPDNAAAVSCETTSTETVLNLIEVNCGYMVKSTSGSKHYIYVIGYTPVNYTGINFVTEGDICNTLTLDVLANVSDLNYYTVTGSKIKLTRQHTLSWKTQEWNATNKLYETKLATSTSGNLTLWNVDAPLIDTKFTVKGDQFAESFGIADSLSSAEYDAVAVKINAQAVINLDAHQALNEIDRSSTSDDLSGTAPMTVDFKSNPSDAVVYENWYIYDTPEVSENCINRKDEDISYTFNESGTSLVKLFVSNATSACSDSASFSPVVLVSSLDCPNFFTPRSTPGENDEFRVAYKSIISFKGTILNRWGNVLFHWTDPAVGWNGTYKGKAVSPGVYFYVIEAKGSDGIVYKKKGDINLLE